MDVLVFGPALDMDVSVFAPTLDWSVSSRRLGRFMGRRLSGRFVPAIDMSVIGPALAWQTFGRRWRVNFRNRDVSSK